MKIDNNKGFTLIELLVAIAIIGILSSIVLSSLNTARTKAEDSKALAEFTQIRTEMEIYFNEYGKYPEPTAGSDIYCITPTCEIGGVSGSPLSSATLGFDYETSPKNSPLLAALGSFSYLASSEFTLDEDNSGIIYNYNSGSDTHDVYIPSQGDNSWLIAEAGTWVLSSSELSGSSN